MRVSVLLAYLCVVDLLYAAHLLQHLSLGSTVALGGGRDTSGVKESFPQCTASIRFIMLK